MSLLHPCYGLSASGQWKRPVASYGLLWRFFIHTLLSIRPLKNSLENLEKDVWSVPVPHSHLARLATHQHRHQGVPQGPVYVFQRCERKHYRAFFFFLEIKLVSNVQADCHMGTAEIRQILKYHQVLIYLCNKRGVLWVFLSHTSPILFCFISLSGSCFIMMRLTSADSALWAQIFNSGTGRCAVNQLQTQTPNWTGISRWMWICHCQRQILRFKDEAMRLTSTEIETYLFFIFLIFFCAQDIIPRAQSPFSHTNNLFFSLPLDKNANFLQIM